MSPQPRRTKVPRSGYAREIVVMNQPRFDPVVAVKRGLALLGQGQFPNAERCARDVLALLPDNVDALNLLGISLTAQERHPESARVFAELTRRQPKVAGHWTNLGTVLRSEQRWDDALNAYRRAADLGETSSAFRLNLGLLHSERGEHEAARAVLSEAHRLAPRDAEIAYHYANSCYELTRLVEGATVLAKWQSFDIHTTEGVAKIALLLMKLNDAETAHAVLERALADPRPDAATRLQLVHVLERTNRLAEARAHLNALLTEALPGVFADEVNTANAKLTQREGRYLEAAGLYSGLVDACADFERKHYFLYPLAKTLDAAGQYDAAFATAQRAHESHSSYLDRASPQPGPRRRDILQITNHGCDEDDYRRWEIEGAPVEAASPVFIVAFPRSGTTLMEQALAAHPQLVTMDEQPFIQLTVERLSAGDAQYPERMAPLTPSELAAAREHYWSLVAQRVKLGAGQRLLDKNPLNILRLPAIRRLFPAAPIVLAIRHPCDVILSCYLQHFRADFAQLCRDLPTLANAYVRTFDYWDQQAQLLQPNVCEIFYEQLVADFAAQMRKVASFVGLPWHSGMLEPAEYARSRGYISTPSYSQVVQPVHDRSVGRWRAYERHLASLLPQLQPRIVKWGYDS